MGACRCSTPPDAQYAVQAIFKAVGSWHLAPRFRDSQANPQISFSSSLSPHEPLSSHFLTFCLAHYSGVSCSLPAVDIILSSFLFSYTAASVVTVFGCFRIFDL